MLLANGIQWVRGGPKPAKVGLHRRLAENVLLCREFFFGAVSFCFGAVSFCFGAVSFSLVP
jgi:hypothetical protein